MAENEKVPAPAALARTEDKLGVLAALGLRFGVDGKKLLEIVKETCFAVGKGEAPFTNDELFLGLTLAHRYALDPFAREVYLFRSRGKVQPIIGLDGWVTLANRQPEYDGCDLAPVEDAQGNLRGYRCAIYRKDRTRPTVVVEDLAECRRDTDPWRLMPRRMLRGKAFAQAVRLAFGVRAPADEADADVVPDTLTPVRVVGPVPAAASAAPEPILVSSGPVLPAKAPSAPVLPAQAIERWAEARAKLSAGQLAKLLEEMDYDEAAVATAGPEALDALTAAARRMAQLGAKAK